MPYVFNNQKLGSKPLPDVYFIDGHRQKNCAPLLLLTAPTCNFLRVSFQIRNLDLAKKGINLPNHQPLKKPNEITESCLNRDYVIEIYYEPKSLQNSHFFFFTIATLCLSRKSACFIGLSPLTTIPIA